MLLVAISVGTQLDQTFQGYAVPESTPASTSDLAQLRISYLKHITSHCHLQRLYRKPVTPLFSLEERLNTTGLQKHIVEKSFVMTCNEEWPQSSKCTQMFSVEGHILLRQDREEIALQSIWIVSCRTLCQMFHNRTDSSSYLKNSLFHISTEFKTLLTAIHISLHDEIVTAENIQIYLAFHIVKTRS